MPERQCWQTEQFPVGLCGIPATKARSELEERQIDDVAGVQLSSTFTSFSVQRTRCMFALCWSQWLHPADGAPKLCL